MPDISQERFLQITVAIVSALVGWLLWNSQEQNRKYYEVVGIVQGVQSRVEGLSQRQSDTIPPVVEASLRELREKTNSQNTLLQERLNDLSGTAINNSNNIGYIKEQVAALRGGSKP